MTFETVGYRKHGPVAILTLNRPDKLNAMTEQMLDDLNRAMDQAEADDAVRAIVLNGAGRAFSAGFDIEGGTGVGGVIAQRKILENDFNSIMRFWDCPKPTVAAVHTYCFGGALEMAVACDLTIASEECRLGEPEVKFGSGIVALLLPWLSGPKNAKAVLLSGNDRLSAHQAHTMGLVNEVVETGKHLDVAIERAHHIATLDSTAVRLTKQAINRSYDIMGMRQALLQALETDIIIESTETPESKEFNAILKNEGLKAALAWREARFGAV